MNTSKKLLILSLVLGSLSVVYAEQAISAEQEAPVAAAPAAESVAPVEATQPAAKDKADATKTEEATDASKDQPSEEELQRFLKQLEEQVGQADEQAK